MADGRLTALKVTKETTPGMYGDGGGLYLQIARGGSKSWIFRYRFKGHTSKAGKPLAREMGLGSVDTCRLAEARERARLQRQLIDDGIDPIEAKKHRETAEALEKAQGSRFRTARRNTSRTTRPVGRARSTPTSGRRPSRHGSIRSSASCRSAGSPPTWCYRCSSSRSATGPDAPTFWTARTETANRVRGRIETVLDWARARKLRDGENPARWKGLLDKLLPAKSQVAPVEHHPALPYKRMAEFWADLRDRDGLGARALEFTILNVTRTEDTIGALWTEIDEEERIWTIPAARIKGKKGRRKRDHIIPLSDAAVADPDQFAALRGFYLRPRCRPAEQRRNGRRHRQDE